MTDIKQKQILERVYIAVSLLFTAVFICEIPGAVFFSPLLLFIAFITYGIYSGRQLTYNISALILLIFTVLFVSFNYDPNISLYYQAYIHLQAVFMYVIGFNFLNDKPVEERKNAIEYYFLFVAVVYILYVLITFYNYFYHTAADLPPRFYYSVWYHSVTKPATVISMCLVFPLIYGTYALFYLPKFKKIIGAVFVFICLFINIKTGTRLLVFFFPFLLTAEFLGWFMFKKKHVKTGVIILAACAVVFIAAIILLLKYKDVLGEKFKNYSFSRFFTASRSTQLRIMYSQNVLEDFKLNYFGGGVHSTALGTPHNIWLYIYDWGGIVSFAVYCVFTVLMIVDYIRLLINKHLSVEFKALLSTAVCLVFLIFMMEPFINPLPSFYILCLFVLGLISGFSKYSPNKTQ